MHFWAVGQIVWLVIMAVDSGYADIDLYTVDASMHDRAVVCYVAHWAKYRIDAGRFLYSSFDSDLCTHIIYSYATLDRNTSQILSKDPKSDHNVEEGGRNGYRDYVDLRKQNRKLKVLLAIGGYEDGVEKYSELVADCEKREIFVASVVAFLKKYNFDGLDLSWKYPGVVGRGGKPEDKTNFSILLKELNNAFAKADSSWGLSISISADKYYIMGAYDFPTILPFVKFINILAFDYHGHWEKTTGFNAPLYRARDRDHENNVKESVELIIRLGAKPNKLVLGIPMFAQTYTLDDSRSRGLGASATEKGPRGSISQRDNFMMYKEVCLELANPGWRTVWDDEQMVPYAFKKTSWISYENETSVTQKIIFALSRQLLGIMLYSIDMDDATGSCSPVKMPMLRTVNKVLAEDFEAFNNVFYSDSGVGRAVPCSTVIIIFYCILLIFS